MTSVQASEIQKNFGEWNDKVHDGPIEITKYGRSVSYLVSARLFHEMWASFRTSIGVEALTKSDVLLIAESSVQTDNPYTLDDIPDIEDTPSFSGR